MGSNPGLCARSVPFFRESGEEEEEFEKGKKIQNTKNKNCQKIKPQKNIKLKNIYIYYNKCIYFFVFGPGGGGSVSGLPFDRGAALSDCERQSRKICSMMNIPFRFVLFRVLEVYFFVLFCTQY